MHGVESGLVRIKIGRIIKQCLECLEVTEVTENCENIVFLVRAGIYIIQSLGLGKWGHRAPDGPLKTTKNSMQAVELKYTILKISIMGTPQTEISRFRPHKDCPLAAIGR